MDVANIDIWVDEILSGVVEGRHPPDTMDPQARKRAKKRTTNYCWDEGKLYFRGLYVPKSEERMGLVSQMHEDLGHFGEQRTLAEICRRYFWYNRT